MWQSPLISVTLQTLQTTALHVNWCCYCCVCLQSRWVQKSLLNGYKVNKGPISEAKYCFRCFVFSSVCNDLKSLIILRKRRRKTKRVIMTKKRTISKKKWKGAKSSIFTAVKRGDKKTTYKVRSWLKFCWDPQLWLYLLWTTYHHSWETQIEYY